MFMLIEVIKIWDRYSWYQSLGIRMRIRSRIVVVGRGLIDW